MLKQLMIIGLTCFAASVHADDWQDAVKESVDATRPLTPPLLADGTPATNDLTVDFNRATWPQTETGWTAIEDGLRVFPYITCSGSPVLLCNLSGYYLAGKQQSSSGTTERAMITRLQMDGTPDVSFHAGSAWHMSAQMVHVNDFAVYGDKLYTVGTYSSGGVEYFAIKCTQLSNPSTACTGFGSAGLVFQSFSSHGATGSAVAKRAVVSESGLHIAGYVKTARGWEIAIARFDKDSGALITQFGGDGLYTGLPAWAAQTNADIDVFDMAVAPGSTPGGSRLYVAGTVKRDATNNYEGYVLGLAPLTGAGISGWGPWRGFAYESDNAGNLKDAITAIAVQRNGKVALAGWSETVANNRRLILARVNADSDWDFGFCGAGLCAPNYSSPGTVDDDLPVAIAERAGNRDLVVALKHINPDTGNPHQSIWQFNSNGNTRRYSQDIDYASGLAAAGWTRPFGMWIGRSGLWASGPEVTAVIGTRQWNNSDFDMTLSHLIANDSIYADQFGGATSD